MHHPPVRGKVIASDSDGEELLKRIEPDPSEGDASFEAGRIYVSVRAGAKGLEYLQWAMALDSSREEFKSAYAEASLQARQGIQVKGTGRRLRER